jgi:hypothetical protein
MNIIYMTPIEYIYSKLQERKKITLVIHTEFEDTNYFTRAELN